MNKTTMLVIVNAAAGFPVVWADEPRPLTSPSQQAIGILTMSSAGGEGYDWRLDVDDAGVETDTDVYWYVYRMSLRVEVYGNPAAPGTRGTLEAVDSLLVIDRKLWRISSLASFRAASPAMVLRDTGDAIGLPTAMDARIVSCAAMDLTVATIVGDDVTGGPDAKGYIEAVNQRGGTGPRVGRVPGTFDP